MKSRLTENQKFILLLLSLSGICFGGAVLDDYCRWNGLPKNQKMKLIKKEVMSREIDLWCDYGEGCLPSKKYAKLSFDTDGNTNTTEVAAMPAWEMHCGIDEVKNLTIGEEKTIKAWDDALQEIGKESYKKTSWSEKKYKIPVLWQFQKQ